MSDRPLRDPAGPLFFVHVMKTGGSTFRLRIKRQLGAAHVFPYAPLDPPEAQPNVRVSYLAGLDAERLASIRAFSGHFPYFVTELVPSPSLVFTVLRDPVERAISYLKQHRRDRDTAAQLSLEQIYDMPRHRNFHILDYQARVFSTTADEGIETVMHRVEIDGTRMEQAKEHLRQVDVLGLHEHYDEFVDDANRRLGWPAGLVVPDQRVSAPVDVPASLRRQIAADNQADLELYAFATELHARRRRAKS